MISIAITSETPRVDESRWIAQILDAGWSWVHLRHPLADEDMMRLIIESIPESYRCRVKIHSHYHLADEYELGGIHLRSNLKELPVGKRYSVSRSCHSIDEARVFKSSPLDYMTLSPVADSLSKKGYNASFATEQLASIDYDDRLVALGGVTPDTWAMLRDYRFVGYAVLGFLDCRPGDELTKRLTLFK